MRHLTIVRLASATEIRHTVVVKTTATSTVPPTRGTAQGAALEDDTAADTRTRDHVVRLLLENKSMTASDIARCLHLTAAGIRRHLDVLLHQGRAVIDEPPASAGKRGRGRPAKTFALTEAGRAQFPHAYDDLAASAVRQLARLGGEAAVTQFATEQVAALESRCREALEDAGDDPLARAEALAVALSREGYAAGASVIASGGQLCQHHCPVAHVAAEFPQLCEAETRAIGRLVGSHVQRLATIAHGDGVCTTHIPGNRVAPAPPMTTTTTTTDMTTKERTSA